MIKETFVTELNKEFSIYDLITFSVENKNNKKLGLINPSNNLKFEVKKDTYKTSISFELGKVHEKESYTAVSDNVFNFGLLRSKKNKTIGEKRKMLEIIDTIKILGLQVETENNLNPTNISLNTNNVIQQLTKYNKYRYRFVLESFLFSSNFENETDVTFLTCNRLSNAKEALINSKIENVLGVTYLSKILNWELAKGQTKRSQAIFVDSEYHNKLSHLAFAFVTRNITDLISFTVALLDDNRKKLTFPSNETKFQQLALELKLQDRQMSRKMNDDKAAEVIKNLFADFKILASKVNDDNKNRKKK